MMAVRAATLAGVVVVTRVAHGDTGAAAQDAAADAAVAEASEANLESTASRRGVTFAAAVSGGLLVGFGIEDSVSRGGGLSLRVGRVATPRTVLTLEVRGTAAFHRPAMGNAVKTNTEGGAFLGAQYYANPSLWLRLAGGVGSYMGRQVAVGNGTLGDVTLNGPAILVGGGLDLARFKGMVFGIEFATTGMVNGDGLLVATSAGLGLQFD